VEAWLLFSVRLITVALVAVVVYSIVDRGQIQQLGSETAVRSSAGTPTTNPPVLLNSILDRAIAILAGLAAFGVAFAVAESFAIRRFRRACQQIDSLGGSIRFDPPNDWTWSRLVFSTATINLSDTSINDQTEIDFVAIPLLKTLRLANTQVAGETIRRLRRCPKLQGLDLTATAIVDEDLRHIGAISNLRSLILNQTAITEAAIPYLKSCPALKELQVNDTAITEQLV